MPAEDMVEITAEQARLLNQGYQLLNLLQSNPKTKRTFEKLVKDHIAPNAITSDDAAEPLLAPLREELAEVKGKFKKLEEQQLDNDFNASLGKVRDKYGLTEDGEETLKKYMVKKSIADPEDAYLAWKGRQPAEPMRPTGMAPSGWGFGELDNEKDTSDMLNNTDDYFDRQASKIWNEVKGEAA